VRPPSIPPAARGRLLIVDDEVSVGRSLQALLEHEHDVALAESGNAALEAIASTGQTFDVIMCDLMMPGMSGMDLYEQIRRRHAGLEQRMVFMTGGAGTCAGNTWSTPSQPPPWISCPPLPHIGEKRAKPALWKGATSRDPSAQRCRERFQASPTICRSRAALY
jgi:hypothetical protein